MTAEPVKAVSGTLLWDGDAFVTDSWTRADDASQGGADSRLILPLDAFLLLDASEIASGRFAPEVLPGEDIARLLPHLARLPLIVLAFPAYNDGRSYSKAELLRTRHGYHGAIRASGDVLVDQIPHMIRVGFSELEVTNPVAQRRLEEGKLTGFALHYQPAAKPSQASGGYSWRRRPSAA
ncbi:MAG: DUF934 domain-containing protein [Notoacmeibacter sp.]|nr:DUF934 domain-containing protein [Notoacmeibacter sp.]MCC0031673.1 DUF934 domain-containing protein [Brucellaceae bacterium]